MLFFVKMNFGPHKARVAELMRGHAEWIERGLDQGVLLLVGSLPEGAGGAVIAYGISREALEARLREDPFVEHQVVVPEIVEVAVSRIQDRASFLLEGGDAGTA